jgi:hypothetical protein
MKVFKGSAVNGCRDSGASCYMICEELGIELGQRSKNFPAP